MGKNRGFNSDTTFTSHACIYDNSLRFLNIFYGQENSFEPCKLNCCPSIIEAVATTRVYVMKPNTWVCYGVLMRHPKLKM